MASLSSRPRAKATVPAHPSTCTCMNDENKSASSATPERLATDRGQTQFLTVITRDEATARFQAHLRLAPLGEETLPLAQALGRILANDVVADIDVPAFDRSNVDGFALQAGDT